VFSQVEEESGRLFGASMHGYIFEVCILTAEVVCCITFFRWTALPFLLEIFVILMVVRFGIFVPVRVWD
jgi:hypothetical protein